MGSDWFEETISKRPLSPNQSEAALMAIIIYKKAGFTLQ